MQIPHNMIRTNFLLADQLDEHPNLHAIVKDAERFLLSNKGIVQRAPLQTYASALVFSPYESQIRKESLAHYPTWFKYGSVVEDHWGPVLQTLQGHRTSVVALAFSFDGKYLASLSVEYELLIWDAITGTLHSTLMEGYNDLSHGLHESDSSLSSRSCLAFSCNGRLAGARSAREILIWEPVTGATCSRITHNKDYKVVAIAFSSDETLAVSYGGLHPQTWIYKAGALPAIVETKRVANVLSFLSDGTLALLCPQEHPRSGSELLLYNPKTQAEERISIPGVGVASFSSNDQLALSKKYSGIICVYDLRKKSNQNLKCAAYSVTALAFSSNNRRLVVVSYDYSNNASVQLYDLDSGIRTVIWAVPNEIFSIAAAPDGRLAIVSIFAREIRILDLQSDSLPSNGDPPGASQQDVLRIVFSPDGKQLVYGSSERFHVLDSATRRELRLLQKQDVAAIAISGEYVAFGLRDGGVYVWNQALKNPLKALQCSTGRVAAVAFSPNNDILIAADYDGAAVIWDMRAWSLQHLLNRQSAEPTISGEITSIAFSQNSKRIAFLYSQGCLSIWDAERYCCLQNFRFEFPLNDIWKNRISVFVEDSYVDTTFGRVYLDQPPDDNGLWNVEEAPWRVYEYWLYRDGQRLLWLPPDFRPTSAARYGDLFVMGHKSGKVTFFEGNNEDSAHESAYHITAVESGSTASSKAHKRPCEADPRPYGLQKRVK